MESLLQVMWPELVLCGTACLLFLLGVSPRPSSRRLAALIAIVALLAVFICQLRNAVADEVWSDQWNTVHLDSVAHYVKTLAAGIGVIFVLLAWPTNEN